MTKIVKLLVFASAAITALALFSALAKSARNFSTSRSIIIILLSIARMCSRQLQNTTLIIQPTFLYKSNSNWYKSKAISKPASLGTILTKSIHHYNIHQHQHEGNKIKKNKHMHNYNDLKFTRGACKTRPSTSVKLGLIEIPQLCSIGSEP